MSTNRYVLLLRGSRRKSLEPKTTELMVPKIGAEGQQ